MQCLKCGVLVIKLDDGLSVCIEFVILAVCILPFQMQLRYFRTRGQVFQFFTNFGVPIALNRE